MRIALGSALVIGLALGSPCPAIADAALSIEPGEDTVKLRAGVFLPSISTNVGVDANDVGGADANLEDLLGLDASTATGFIQFTWRMAPRHRLNLGYFGWARGNSTVAERNVEIGDGEIIAAGANVVTDFELQIIPLIYQYSFIKTPSHELAASLGLHWTKVSFRTEASAWVEDDLAQGFVTAEAMVPLPMIGVAYTHWISDRWSINTAAEGFALSLSDGDDNYDGSAYNLRLGTEYWIWNNFGVGAAVNAFGVNLDLGTSDWNGSSDFGYWGPQIYVMARF